MTALRFSKLVVAICGGVPLAILAWDAIGNHLGADPVNYAIRTTGLLSLIFLVLSLVVTPLRRLTGWNTLISYRRSLGLYGFAYACVHLAIYVWFDRALNLASVAEEIFSRRYLQIGFAGVLVMVPLAITSTDAMIRRLGPRRWKALHRLAYVAAIAGAIHYILLVKSDLRQPIVFAVVLGVLLLARAVWHYVDLRRAAARGNAKPAVSMSPLKAKEVKARKFWTGELVVARTFDETPEVRTFRLAPAVGDELPFDYKPGQYLTLRLQVDGKLVNRSYTIASSPTRRGYCELTVKREEMGISSGHLHRQIRQGDRLSIAAPAGRFVFTGNKADSVVLISGGVGITPMMSILRYLTDHSWPGDIYFIVAARSESDIIFRAEIEQLQRRFPNLNVCVTLSRSDPNNGWTGERGRITPELLTRFIPELARRSAFICGPDEMMNATRQFLLNLGVPEASVKTEAFVAAKSQVAEAGATAADQSPSIADEPPSIADEALPIAEGEPLASGLANGDRTITFTKSNSVGSIDNNTTVLEAAEEAGVDIPFECRSGVCGQCKTKLVSGTVKMADAEALSKREKTAGWILACQARATNGNVAVEA